MLNTKWSKKDDNIFLLNEAKFIFDNFDQEQLFIFEIEYNLSMIDRTKYLNLISLETLQKEILNFWIVGFEARLATPLCMKHLLNILYKTYLKIDELIAKNDIKKNSLQKDTLYIHIQNSAIMTSCFVSDISKRHFGFCQPIQLFLSQTFSFSQFNNEEI
ncbi:hypothetical protein BpHYR1_029933 [Brachionus plicatilis]|uniref:Uncharacterized protein n=1 Tax=Brachionus plicatilis TaxID=10195 RepID=A0A3M7QJI0_BRAPC|nr:hypothetical protein BpHYR1_029933 [Brachionus plicatilis]